jgi:ABC-type dipeptide/oligopeptide/nickel transport system ATPase component
MEAFVQVDTHYTRSINLERDIDSNPILNAYIPTSKAMMVLDKIATTFNEQSMPRAWSLVGPYGSGKSSFAIFLTHLLEDQNNITSVTAEELLTKHNSALAQKFIAHTQGSNAYCTVLLTGSSESLSKRLLKALHLAAETFWQEKQGKKPDIIRKLAIAAQEGATVSEILVLLEC